MITQSELKSILHYSLETGVFTWKTPRSNNSIKINYKVGTLQNGYLHIHLNYKRYLAHRLAWLYVYGTWPNGMLDHINGNKEDNRIINLRESCNRKNQQNQYKHREGHLVGTTFHKKAKKWRARIRVNKQLISLGLYNTQLEAHKAYLNKLKEVLNNKDSTI